MYINNIKTYYLIDLPALFWFIHKIKLKKNFYHNLKLRRLQNRYFLLVKNITKTIKLTKLDQFFNK